MDIRKLPIKDNKSSRAGQKIKYIVIHDTGNKGKNAGAYNHYLYFSGGNRKASAHYFVDSKEIIQIIDDSMAAWHVGDGKGKYGVTNSNSIGIEICINPESDYKVALDKTIELVKDLMHKYHIPVENVIRHYDASHKICPGTMSANNWQAWHDFKARLGQEPEGIKVDIKGKIHYIDGVMKNDKNYVSIRELAEALGYRVEWDNIRKVVRII